MWETDHWESSVDSGVPRRDRRSGEYSRYVPAPLVGAPLRLDASLDELVATAEREVRAVSAERGHQLVGISRFLLRSEAIASSRIEGIAPSAKQVALAELGRDEEVRGISDQAQLVADNMTVVREATTRLVRIDRVSVSDVVDLHAILLPAEPRHHGIRTVQNWIGGSDWHPFRRRLRPAGSRTARRPARRPHELHQWGGTLSRGPGGAGPRAVRDPPPLHRWKRADRSSSHPHGSGPARSDHGRGPADQPRAVHPEGRIRARSHDIPAGRRDR